MMSLRKVLWISMAASLAVCGMASMAMAQTTTLFAEDFSDDMFETFVHPEEFIIDEGTIVFQDDSGDRGKISVVQDWSTVPVLTYSWDFTLPVVERTLPASFEAVWRAGTGTGTNSLQSGDFIAEAIFWRDGPRSNFQNNGNETAFVVLNNQNATVEFTNPVDSTPFTLNPFSYITYLQDRTSQAFTVFKGMTTMTDRNGAELGAGANQRFSIGSSSSGHQGTFGMDGLLVLEGATFARTFDPPATPGDVDGDDDVDMDDFAIIQMNFQKAFTERTDGDLVNDNVVDFRDFRQWKSNFPAPVELAALGVPEPSTALLAGLAVAAGVAVRRRKR
jgi:hypothetical protein